MTLLGLVLVGLVTYLIMRRRGRVFLETEEAAMLVVYCLLAIVQKLVSGNVSLNDHFVTPLYFALPVVVGHARGPARGATCGILGGAAVIILASAFARLPQALTLSQIPGQYLMLLVVLGIAGAVAGMRQIPKALKPFSACTWILFVAIYHPEYLEGVNAYVTQFAAVTLASLGLYFNPFKPAQSPIHYPTSPSRRA